jgi:hypothetical protein
MGIVTHLKKSGDNFAFPVSNAFLVEHNMDVSGLFSMKYVAGKIIIEALPETIVIESEDSKA